MVHILGVSTGQEVPGSNPGPGYFFLGTDGEASRSKPKNFPLFSPFYVLFYPTNLISIEAGLE